MIDIDHQSAVAQNIDHLIEQYVSEFLSPDTASYEKKVEWGSVTPLTASYMRIW
jgi:hypothetical protein